MTEENTVENGIAPDGEAGGSSVSEGAETADAPETGSAPRQTSIEAAFERAEQQLSKEKTNTNGKQASGNSPSEPEQAASGDSTPPPSEPDTPAIGDNDGTSGLATDDSTPADSSKEPQSLIPPDSWPKERLEQFKTLPDTAKTLTLDFYRDMERGLKQSFDKLATERKALSDQFGLDADQIKDLSERAKAFQSDPTSVISQLAKEAGIDVFFKEQTDQIPEFDSQKEMTNWLIERTQREARQAAADQAKSLQQQQHQADVKQKLDAEFAEAIRAHPDIGDHQEAVINYIKGFNIPVEMAYRLATHEGLTTLARNGQKTLADLNKAKAELEKLQKLETMPPGHADGRSQKARSNGLDPFEAAFQRAEKTLGR